jgi:hypothetical protein
MAEVDLTFLARQGERILSEIEMLRRDNTSFRDDMRVLTAMVLRQDGTLARLLDEVRAVHAQIDHMNDRVRKLEDAEE